MFELSDKVAIVTGSGKGIGRAIALAYADAGADVVVTARTASDIEAVAAEIQAKGRKSLPVVADVREADQVANLVEKTISRFGKIDILVNNVGGGLRSKFIDLSERAWDGIIRLSLKTVFLCTKAAARVMIEQNRGNIINIGSNLSEFPSPYMSAYGAAKAALVHLTRTLAVELAPHNIRVNIVISGLVETSGMAEFHRDHPEQLEANLARIPLKRLGRPEDIAGAAIYLASEASAYVTGSAISVEGGGFVGVIP